MRYQDDHELLERVLSGDEQAYDCFVDEYYPRLYRFVFPRVGADPDIAQDVVQSTFLKIMPKLRKWRGEAALFSWMCSFCRFEIAAHWRNKGRRAPEVQLAEDCPQVQAAIESLAVHEEGPDAVSERNELSRLVRVALDVLPIRYGNALEWKYIQGLSVREVARRLETSEKAAESVLTRARRAFRDGFAAVAGG